MTARQPWAKTTLRIDFQVSASHRLRKALGDPDRVVNEDRWVWDVEADTAQPLDQQFEALTRMLEARLNVLTELADQCTISVNVGWSPAIPQDGLALAPELTNLLGQLRVLLLVDTYIDEDNPLTCS